MDIIQRRVGEQDGEALAAFRCRKLGEPWADDLDDLIRHELIRSITASVLEVEGLWVDDVLAALIAWRPERDPEIDPEQIRPHGLAVLAVGRRRKPQRAEVRSTAQTLAS